MTERLESENGAAAAISEDATSGKTGDQRHGDTVEFVVRHLLNGIIKGRFAPGQRLVARDIQEEIGISRSSVREAFRLMAADGLVDLIPNRGVSVRRLTRSQTRDLFQIREALESMAAKLAALNINNGSNRRTFLSVLEQMGPKDEARQWSSFIEHNRLFHHTIVQVSGNQLLEDMLDKLQLPIMMVQIGRAMNQSQIARSEDDHSAIAEGILNGDPDLAQTAMQEHLSQLARWVLKLPEEAFKRE